MLRINRLLQLVFVVTSLTTSETAFAFSLEGDIGVGYRKDAVDWNFAGGPGGPNILSELKWNNLCMVNYYGQLRVSMPVLNYARLTGNYGSIFNGTNTDWDYNGDDRTDPFSHAINKADKGEAFELSAAIGWPLPRWIEALSIVPLIGYSQQEQHLQLYDGFQALYVNSPFNNTSIPDLASNYRAKWYTPFIGVDLFYRLRNKWKIIATGEWHGGRYCGEGFWNLRTDFLSDIRHRAYISGVVLRLQGLYNYLNFYTLGLIGEYTYMRTGRGINQVDISQSQYDFSGQFLGNQQVTAEGQLNGVHWHSWRIILTTGFDF